MTDTGAPSSPPPPPRPSYYGQRRLFRFPDDGPLGGVCAGVADYLSIDPTIVRIAAVVLAITGPGIPAYLLAWLIVPAADGTVIAPFPRHGERRHDRFQGLLFVLLLFLVLFFFVDHWWWRPVRGWFWPVGLIAVGGWLLLRHHGEDVPPPPIPPAPPTPPGTPSSPWQASPPTSPTSVVPVPSPLPPTGTTEPTSPSPTPDADGPDTTEVHDVLDTDTTTLTHPTEVADAPTESFEPPTTVLPPGGIIGEPPPPYDDHHHRRPRRRRVLGPVVFGVLLLWGGIAWLAGVSATTGLAVGLCLVGAGFVVGAFTGGSRGLILPALVIAIALVVASTVNIPLSGGIGDRRDDVSSMRDLHRTYELAIGQRVLDLHNLVLPDKTTDVTIKQGIGHLSVIVPDDVTVVVDSKASIGSVELFDHQEGGTNVQIGRQVQGLHGAGTLHLRLTLGIGRIDVRRETPSIDQTSTSGPTPTSTPTTPATPVVPTTPAAHAAA